ncbi:integral membrane protein [Xylariales sp. PMI_506]|nr:integral membrane protein [Xylariales sp. PMI_506]
MFQRICQAFAALLHNIAESRWMSKLYLQIYCAISGFLMLVFFFVGLIVAGLLPPIDPAWSAEKTAEFIQTHSKRIEVGAYMIIISGMFYLPMSAAMSHHIRRVPNLPYLIHQLQLASATAGVFSYILPGAILAAAAFRPERPAEITQALSDLFWLVSLMPWPTFLLQSFTYAWAILKDNREKPLFPKWLGLINIIMPCLYIPASAIHCYQSGPFAWNGVFGFWIYAVAFGIVYLPDCWFLIVAARAEAKEDAEKAMYSHNSSKTVVGACSPV